MPAVAEPITAERSPDLSSSLRRLLKAEGITLITRRTGEHGLQHGIAVAAVCEHLRSPQLAAIRQGAKSAATVRSGLALIGDPFEFSDPPLKRLLKAAGYPLRSKIAGMGRIGSHTVLDALPEKGRPESLELSSDVGLVFCSVTQDLLRLPVIVINGTSPCGLLSAAIAATNCRMLSRIERPDAFPDEPLLIVTRMQKDGSSGNAAVPSNVLIESVSCSAATLDLRSRSWCSSKATTVRLVSAGSSGSPKAIFVNRVKLANSPESDLFKLLWALAQRSAKGRWTSLKEAACLVDHRVDTTKTSEKTHQSKNVRSA
ncbi:MAG: hypothetical protein Q7T05_07480 [Dehalococcoidia bacterium]|nr:hypothetical protein [Dehalococcoidia bacterium]